MYVTPDDGGIVVGNLTMPLVNPVIYDTRVLGGSNADGIVLINPLNYLILNTNTGLLGGDGITIHGQPGLAAGIVSTCASSGNAGSGFLAAVGDANSMFVHCAAIGNQGAGFDIEGDNTNYISCCARSNGTDGFVITSDDNILHDCISADNGSAGFAIRSGINNDLHECVAIRNADSGFFIDTAPNTINSNTGSGNIGFGFNATLGGNRIYANYANDNGAGNYSAAITNVAVSPTPADPINFTTNISD